MITMNDGVNRFLIFDYDIFMMVEVYEVILEQVLLYSTQEIVLVSK